jgi:hypothetical protein
MLQSIQDALQSEPPLDELKVRFNFGKDLFFQCPSDGRAITVKELLVWHHPHGTPRESACVLCFGWQTQGEGAART